VFTQTTFYHQSEPQHLLSYNPIPSEGGAQS
jgi:hypothetical protein